MSLPKVESPVSFHMSQYMYDISYYKDVIMTM